jgi:hypothetical protein
VQIHNTTLTKRQSRIISGALTKEYARATDAMRILYLTDIDSGTRARATTAILALTDEITTLMNLINEDQEHSNA